ncbi:Aminotransferase class I/classII domain-containing protein [Plasmodiophora brassicae]
MRALSWTAPVLVCLSLLCAASVVTRSNPFDMVGSLVATLLRSWMLYIQATFNENPGHVIIETACIAAIFYLLFHRRFDPGEQQKLSLKEEEELLKEWVPQPLTPTVSKPFAPPVMTSATENGFVTVASETAKKLNLSTCDFLGLSGMQSIKDACKQTIMQYGVGSCSPRGFYGTVTPHLLFEDEMAKFMGAEAAILYSDSLATVSSIVAAFSKAGDLIICDDGVRNDVLAGVSLSRSHVIFFKHNDMEDLERILENVAAADRKRSRKSLNRRFIVVEGVYQNYGDICPIEVVVDLKKRYHYRIILDDSLGFGVLGTTGRGTCEMKGIPVQDIDIWCTRMDTAMASVGGVCCGSLQVVEHQRLGAAGYVFSASSPMFSCTAAVEALKVIDAEPERAERVRANGNLLRAELRSIEGVVVGGSTDSPLTHLRLSTSDAEEHSLGLYRRVAQSLFDNDDILVSVSSFTPHQKMAPPPSICLYVGCHSTREQLVDVAKRVAAAFASALEQPARKKPNE